MTCVYQYTSVTSVCVFMCLVIHVEVIYTLAWYYLVSKTFANGNLDLSYSWGGGGGEFFPSLVSLDLFPSIQLVNKHC